MRQTLTRIVPSFEAAVQFVAQQGLGGRVFVDLENTLMPSGGAVAYYAQEIDARLRALADLPSIDHVTVVTNRKLSAPESQLMCADVVADAHKPRLPAAHGSTQRPDIVIGDESLTTRRRIGCGSK